MLVSSGKPSLLQASLKAFLKGLTFYFFSPLPEGHGENMKTWVPGEEKGPLS